MKKLSLLTLATGLFLSINVWGAKNGEDTTEQKPSAPQEQLAMDQLKHIPMEMEQPVAEPIFNAKARFQFQLDRVVLKPFYGEMEEVQPLP